MDSGRRGCRPIGTRTRRDKEPFLPQLVGERAAEVPVPLASRYADETLPEWCPEGSRYTAQLFGKDPCPELEKPCEPFFGGADHQGCSPKRCVQVHVPLAIDPPGIEIVVITTPVAPPGAGERCAVSMRSSLTGFPPPSSPDTCRKPSAPAVCSQKPLRKPGEARACLSNGWRVSGDGVGGNPGMP